MWRWPALFLFVAACQAPAAPVVVTVAPAAATVPVAEASAEPETPLTAIAQKP